MQFQSNLGAISEQFWSNFGAISEQFHYNLLTTFFKSSFRAILEQFWCSFRAVSFQFVNHYLQEQFQSKFGATNNARALYEQFQSSIELPPSKPSALWERLPSNMGNNPLGRTPQPPVQTNSIKFSIEIKDINSLLRLQKRSRRQAGRQAGSQAGGSEWATVSLFP